MHDDSAFYEQRGYSVAGDSYNTPGLSVAQSLQLWTGLFCITVYVAYKFLQYLDFAHLSPPELFWNAIVWITPVSLINALAHISRKSGVRIEMANVESDSEVRAMKSGALMALFGLGAVMSPLSFGTRTMLAPSSSRSKKPPGLGNWDNSCYQNSVLQGLAALEPVHKFLEHIRETISEDEETTTGSLHSFLRALGPNTDRVGHIWTPAKLKSMSSWQQQDAQEYYSRILDDVDKDLKSSIHQGGMSSGLDTTEKIASEYMAQLSENYSSKHSPLEGLLGQRVACTACGFTDGLTLLPFNCLTLSPAQERVASLENCLDDYTDLEEIEGVECLSCTFRQQQAKVRAILQTQTDLSAITADQSTLRDKINSRLNLLDEAITDEIFTDGMAEKCNISKKSRVTSTKTKQVILARRPKALALHINRSVFNEMTGDLQKNHVVITYPQRLSLEPWMIGKQSDKPVDENREIWSTSAETSMLANNRVLNKFGQEYVLKAVITHTGKHEDGHYICYRQHSYDGQEEHEKTSRWWCMNDELVTEVTEETVLCQRGVFMLFYELIQSHSEIDTKASKSVFASAFASEKEQQKDADSVKMSDEIGDARHERVASQHQDVTTADSSFGEEIKPGISLPEGHLDLDSRNGSEHTVSLPIETTTTEKRESEPMLVPRKLRTAKDQVDSSNIAVHTSPQVAEAR